MTPAPLHVRLHDSRKWRAKPVVVAMAAETEEKMAGTV